MRAGLLDRRITLRRYATARSALGSQVKAWNDLAEVYAAYLPVSDAERVKAAQVGASLTARFQIRWDPQVADLSPLDQLRDEYGRDFAIVGVKELGRRVGLEISARALADKVSP